MNNNNQKRIIWLDSIKGFLIFMVVLYHLIYDLSEIYNIKINLNSFYLKTAGFIGATAFILICGISSNFSRNNLKRGIKLIVIALFITFITYLYNKNYYVKFGILHLLGILTILYHFYQNASYKQLFLILIISFVITITIPFIQVENPYLFPIGIYNTSFISSDYYPIFGFIIPFIIGNICGKYLKTKSKIFTHKNNLLALIGQHTLIIYLVHQPLLLGILHLIFKKE